MQAEAALMFFKRREKGYMVRPERRNSYNNGTPGGKKPRRGRGYTYGVFAILVSAILWPLGMLLLWTRKLRWAVGVKLMASVLTLILSLCGIGWGLTVQTDDWRITRTQDKINGFLADSTRIVTERVSAAASDIASFSTDLYDYSRAQLARGIVAGADLADDVKGGVSDQIAKLREKPSPVPSSDPAVLADGSQSSEGTGEEPTAEASAAPTPAATPTVPVAPTEFLAATPDAVETPAPTIEATPTATPDVGERLATIGDAIAAFAQAAYPATIEPTETPTAEPTATPTAEPTATPTAEPTTTPTAEPTATPTAEPTATPTAEPTATPTAEPTATPTPTAAPTPTIAPTAEITSEPTIAPTSVSTPSPAQESVQPTALDLEAEPTPAPTLKPAGEAIVYHSSNGVGYHVRSSCTGMSGAKPYTLAESVEDGFRSCGNCHPAEESLLATDEPVVWVDKSDVYHTSDECAEFDGQYALMTLKDAYEKDKTPCAVCGATSYVYVPDATPELTAEPTPTPEPTATPAQDATATPVPEAQATKNPAVASATLKPAGEAIVYHTTNGRAYHMASTCRSMSNAKPYTLAECVAEGFGSCGICDAPDESLVNEECVWIDEAGLCHISDECQYFEGRFTLKSLADAASEGLEGCPFCGMGDILTRYQSQKDAQQAQLVELSKTVTVYYNDNSRYYHAADSCVNMPSADAHTLYDATQKGLKRCNRCDPPALEDLADQLDANTGN